MKAIFEWLYTLAFCVGVAEAFVWALLRLIGAE